MARYIDADKLYTRVKEKTNPYGKPTLDYESGVKVLDMIKEAPTADVVEVRHGYWKPSPDGVNPIRCSECNMPAPMALGENEFGDFVISRYPSSYCHECGAKMDGGKME